MGNGRKAGSLPWERGPAAVGRAKVDDRPCQGMPQERLGSEQVDWPRNVINGPNSTTAAGKQGQEEAGGC